VNCTGNSATLASGFVVDPCECLSVQFCRFHSNFGGNVLTFSETSRAAAVYKCIDFVNNTIGNGSAILVASNCTIRHSLFILTHIDSDGAFVSGGPLSPLFSVIFVRCTFDTSALPADLVKIVTESCAVRDSPPSLDMEECRVLDDTPPAPSPSPARTAGVCERYSCDSASGLLCLAVIDITDVFFDGCQSDGDGGAVRITHPDTVCQLIRDEFRACAADNERSGGAVFFYGKSVSLFAFTGTDCVAHAEAFCRFQIVSAATGSIALNQSYSLHGICGRNGFCTEYSTYDSGSREILNALNFTANYADIVASAIWIDTHFALQMRFCRSCSNAPRNVLAIEAPKEADSIGCLEFIDNRVTSSGSDSGLINTNQTLLMEGCVFFGNQLDFLLGGRAGCKLTFLHCVFDRTDMFLSTGGIMIQTESCGVQESGSISLDLDHCPTDILLLASPTVPSGSGSASKSELQPAPTATATDEASAVYPRTTARSASSDPTETLGETGKSDDSPSMTMWVGVGSGLAALVIAALIAGIVIKHCRAREKEKSSQTTYCIDLDEHLEGVEYINPATDTAETISAVSTAMFMTGPE
jgi:hypothetical protein